MGGSLCGAMRGLLSKLMQMCCEVQQEEEILVIVMDEEHV